jgi:hypothetical protein
MQSDWSQWTNDFETWRELGLDRAGCFLWRLDIRAPENYYPGWFDPQYRDITSRSGWKQANKIFIIDREGWAADFFSKDPRVYIWDSTILPNSHPAYSRFHPNFFWFDWVREIESYQNFLSRIGKPASDSWTFECMLGRRKPWRNKIYDSICQDPQLCSEVKLSYPGLTGQWMAGFDHDGGSEESTDRVNYYDRMTGNRSCFIPWRIYNQSFYSLVAETNHDRLFFTEKTAKPLMARRIFLLFAAPGSLRALRKLGFQTFGDIVDESYDDIQDHDQRQESVLYQAKELSKIDYREVFEKLRPVLDHNHRHFMSMDWNASLKKEIKELI